MQNRRPRQVRTSASDKDKAKALRGLRDIRQYVNEMERHIKANNIKSAGYKVRPLINTASEVGMILCVKEQEETDGTSRNPRNAYYR